MVQVVLVAENSDPQDITMPLAHSEVETNAVRTRALAHFNGEVVVGPGLVAESNQAMVHSSPDELLSRNGPRANAEHGAA